MKSLVRVALVLLAALPALGQEPPQMTPEQRREMEAHMRAATPGAQHAELAKFAGTWNARVRFWPAPGAPAMESDGVSENRMILGGRYLEQRFTSSMMGMPFEGLGYSGYDNVKKQHWSTWIDTSTTGLMTSYSPKGGDGSTMRGTMVDPLSRKDSRIDSTVVVRSSDEHVFEMWGPDKKGRKYRMMEIVYTRKK